MTTSPMVYLIVPAKESYDENCHYTNDTSYVNLSLEMWKLQSTEKTRIGPYFVDPL